MHDLKCFSPMFSQEKLLMLHTHHGIKCQATPVLARNTPVCQKHKTRSTCVDTLTRQHWDRAPAFQARPLHLPLCSPSQGWLWPNWTPVHDLSVYASAFTERFQCWDMRQLFYISIALQQTVLVVVTLMIVIDDGGNDDGGGIVDDGGDYKRWIPGR